MHSNEDQLSHLLERLRGFVAERDWEQYHSPKNLAMALTGEVGELVEHFQWLTEAQSRELPEAELQAVREEIADVQIYLMLLADRLGLDLMKAVDDKIRINAAKYPTDRARGTSRK
ncbi:MAG: nucleotide pyrophosphohydrolase [Gammaproteobacteria bacterium]|nr:nucleotide pyrophosphohydrolase [Gammaproteobacteria bacterium]